VAKVEEAIEVSVPVRTAYNQWTQFEQFPRFMENVEAVQQLDDKRLHWVAKVAGKRKEWDAKITEQVPDQKVAWESTTGARNAGKVTFEGRDGRTRVNVQMEVEPEGAVESAGTALGGLQREVKEDLKRFKDYIEQRGQETGAWRGEIRDEQTTSTRR
jgi:uncharacterized membrane protein